MAFLLFVALQAAGGWTMPGDGHWPTDTTSPPIAVSLTPATVSMGGRAPIDVSLTAHGPNVRVSRFLQPTTGIAFEVETLEGRVVMPIEPMAGSPPPPPPSAQTTTGIADGETLVIHTGEAARMLFPGPGIYRMRAVILLFDSSTQPVHRLRAESAPVTITVTP